MESSQDKYGEVDSEKGFSNEEKANEAQVVVREVHAPRTGFFGKVRCLRFVSREFQTHSSQLWDFVLYIDRFGVEVRGIERVRPEDRTAT